MKKSIYTLGMSAMLLVPLFMSCDSKGQEEAIKAASLNKFQLDAAAKEKEAKEAEEWAALKSTSEGKIKARMTLRIEELRIKKAKPGKVLDPIYAGAIDALQQRNADLQARMDAYEKDHSDWEAFKTELEHDMDELGKAIEDLGVDNKK
jgi:hypothetical protein